MRIIVKSIYLCTAVITFLLSIFYLVITFLVVFFPNLLDQKKYGINDWRGPADFLILYVPISLVSFLLFRGINYGWKIAKVATFLLGILSLLIFPLAFFGDSSEIGDPTKTFIRFGIIFVLLITAISFLVYSTTSFKENG